jgi:hypothetical protein
MWGQPPSAVRRAQRGVYGTSVGRTLLSAAFDFVFDFALPVVPFLAPFARERLP